MQNRATTTKKTLKRGGFTLIEVLVSLSIFTVVVTISVGTLLVLIDANSKSQAMQVVMSNLSFALDSMTREIRTGDAYFCANNENQLNNTRNVVDEDETRDCTNGTEYFAFSESGGSITLGTGSRRIQYRLSENAGRGSIERRLGTINSPNNGWVPVTSPDVDVNELDFVVTGTNPGDEVTPTVTIYISGQVGTVAKTSSDFQIQTTVAQILLDI